MGKKKKMPLEKIRRRALWPSFVFFIIICVIFALVFPILTGYFFTNIISHKNRSAYESALSLQSLFEESNTTDFSKLRDELFQFQKINPGIKEICLVSSSNEILMQSGPNKPDFSNNLTYDNGEYTVIINQDIYDMVSPDGEEKPSSTELFGEEGKAFRKLVLEKIIAAGVSIFVAPNEKVVVIPCWVLLDEEMPSGGKLCVKSELFIQAAEIAPFIITILICVFFCLLMVLWFVVAFIHQLVDRRRFEEIINLDTVTGGNNWLYYVKKASKILRRNRYRHNHYAVVSISMMKFTNYCTCYGVSNGEALLEKFYTSLQECVGKKEVAVRHEHAEFALLLLMEDEVSLEQRLKKITFMMSSVIPDQCFHFAIGVYIIDRNEDNITEIYNSAAIARNCCAGDSVKEICYFTAEMYNEQVWERKVENDMEKALYNHEFEVYLQPKYDTMKETLSAAEALVRWNHPTEGSVPPGKFIPIFESNGFIVQLDDFMLTEVCRLQAAWISRKEPVVPISVNVSRAHFTKNDLAEHICKIVDFFKVPHSVIELELTESAFFDDKTAMLNTVKKLRNVGFKVSMDDFGAGYSSLNTLKEIPLDVVKLDAEFFRGKDEMNRGRLIVEETISLAKKLNMQIVAEGIETREQVDFLKKNGCDLIQGFFFAKPMSVPDFEKSAFKQNQGNVRSIE